MRDIVIVCTGPSLNQTPPELIDRSRFVTISMNGIYHHPTFIPDFWVCEDALFFSANINEVIKWHEENIRCTTLVIPDYLPGARELPYVLALPSKRNTSYNWEFSPTHLTYGATVTYIALQLAWILGSYSSLRWQKVYIIGLDHNYEYNGPDAARQIFDFSEDPNHFVNNYFREGQLWHTPDLKRMEAAYKAADDFYREHGVMIYNCTPDSKCEVFERGEFSWLAT